MNALNTMELMVALMMLTGFLGCQAPSSPTQDSSLLSASPSAEIASSATSVRMACPDSGVHFTHAVTELDSLLSVSPLPALAGGVALEGRSYMYVKSGLEGVEIPIYAPTKMTLFASKNYRPLGAPEGYHAEWSLAFDAGCGVTVGFAHIKEVSSRILEVNQGALSESSATVPVSAPVTFEAGEVIGYYIKGLSSIAWDFIVQDGNIQNPFVNEDRYLASGSKLLHVICPYDLFDEPIKSDFLSLLGSTRGGPVPGTRCGTVARDKVGTAAGGWFADAYPLVGAPAPLQDGSFGNTFTAFASEDGDVYLANLDRTYQVIDPTNPTYLDPQDITTEHCYQLYPTPDTAQGWIYLSLLDDTTLRVSYSITGLCPAMFPSEGAKTFYR